MSNRRDVESFIRQLKHYPTVDIARKSARRSEQKYTHRQALTKHTVPDNEQKTHRQTHAYISTGAEKYYSGKQCEFTPRTTEKVSYMKRTSTN